MDSKGKARSGLTIFFAVLVAGSAYFEHQILVLGGSIQNHLEIIFALVWWVTVASIVARLVMRESPRDVSFRWGGSAGLARSQSPLQCRLWSDSPPMESAGAQAWQISGCPGSPALCWECTLLLL